MKTNSNHSGLKQLLFIIYLNFEGQKFEQVLAIPLNVASTKVIG